MNETLFDAAKEYFSSLKDNVRQNIKRRIEPSGISVSSQDGTNHFFNSAMHATTILYSFGKKELLKYEKECGLHNSTGRGGFLTTSMIVINHYFGYGKATLGIDECEDLERTCQFAKMVVEKTGLDYVPLF